MDGPLVSKSVPSDEGYQIGAPANAESSGARRGHWRTAAELILLAVLLAFALVRPFFVEPFYIPSASMLPALRPGDRILVDKLSYRLGEPARGEIIVFYGPEDSGHPDEIFVKRIVGLPGEHLFIAGGKTYVEGVRIREPYLKSLPNGDFHTVVVPKDAYFVMGDNRGNSFDSRYWGAVPKDLIIGHAVCLFWPFRRARLLR
jgi:signal peptidase I